MKTSKLNKMKQEFKDQIENILSNENNYKSGYTGTPVFLEEKATPELINLINKDYILKSEVLKILDKIHDRMIGGHYDDNEIIQYISNLKTKIK